jgi:hypothetical protein
MFTSIFLTLTFCVMKAIIVDVRKTVKWVCAFFRTFFLTANPTDGGGVFRVGGV